VKGRIRNNQIHIGDVGMSILDHHGEVVLQLPSKGHQRMRELSRRSAPKKVKTREVEKAPRRESL
jgi:hypothetical protein